MVMSPASTSKTSGAATGARAVQPIPFSTYGTCVTEALSGSLSPFKLFIEGLACSAGSYETAFSWLWSQPRECEEPPERVVGPPNRCWRAWQPGRGQQPHTSSAQGPRSHVQPVAMPSDHLGMNERTSFPGICFPIDDSFSLTGLLVSD